MTRGDPKQRDRWAVGFALVLFPVAERVNADSDCLGELSLRESYKVSKIHRVIVAPHPVGNQH